MRRDKFEDERGSSGSGGGSSWISYSDMMASLLLVFLLMLCVSLFQYFTAPKPEDPDQKVSIEEQLKEIEEREAAIKERETAIKERETAIKEQETAIEERETAIQERETKLNEKETGLNALESQIAEREKSVAEKEAELKARETALKAAQEQLAKDRADLETERTLLENERAALTIEKEQLTKDQEALKAAQEQLATDQNALKAAQEQLATDQETLKAGQEQLTTDQEALKAAQEQLTTDQNALKATQEQLATDQNALKAAQEQLAKEQEALKSAQEQLTTDQNALKAAQEQLAKEQEALKAAQEQLTKDQEALKKAQEQQEKERADLETEKAQLGDDRAALTTEKEQLTKDQTELKAGQEQLATDQEALKIAQEQLAKDQEAVKAAKEQLTKDQEAMKAALEQLAKVQETLNAEQEQLKKDQEQLQKDRAEVERQMAELKALQEQQAALENYSVRSSIISNQFAAFSGSGQEISIDPDTGEIVLANSILFDAGSDVLSPEGKAFLNEFIPVYLDTLMKPEYEKYISEIIIEGHTDTRGTYLGNLSLSQSRAGNVMEYCLNMPGLTEAQKEFLRTMASATGRGYADPVYDQYGNVDLEACRRVEFKFRMKESGILSGTGIVEELTRVLGDSGLEVSVDENTGDIQLSSAIMFESNSAEVKEEGQAFIRRFLPIYLDVLMNPEYQDDIGVIIIEGYTDNKGTYAANLALSQQRATNVMKECLQVELTDEQKEYLRKKMTATGRSYANLIYQDDGQVDLAASRRVVFKFRLKDLNSLDELMKIIRETSNQAEE